MVWAVAEDGTPYQVDGADDRRAAACLEPTTITYVIDTCHRCREPDVLTHKASRLCIPCAGDRVWSSANRRFCDWLHRGVQA